MRNITILAIVLFILGLGLVYESAAQFENTISNNSALQSAMVFPHNTVVVPVQISNNTVIGTVYFSNNTKTAYYLVNQSAFSQISQYLNSSALLNATKKLEGQGVLEITYNSSSGEFPYQNTSISNRNNYFYNGSGILASGTYYNIFQNFGNSDTLVYYSIVRRLQVSVNSTIVMSSGLSLLGFVILIIGVILFGYSIFVKKDEEVKKPTEETDIDALYSRYSNRKPKPRSKRKRSRSAK